MSSYSAYHRKRSASGGADIPSHSEQPHRRTTMLPPLKTAVQTATSGDHPRLPPLTTLDSNARPKPIRSSSSKEYRSTGSADHRYVPYPSPPSSYRSYSGDCRSDWTLSPTASTNGSLTTQTPPSSPARSRTSSIRSTSICDMERHRGSPPDWLRKSTPLTPIQVPGSHLLDTVGPRSDRHGSPPAVRHPLVAIAEPRELQLDFAGPEPLSESTNALGLTLDPLQTRPSSKRCRSSDMQMCLHPEDGRRHGDALSARSEWTEQELDNIRTASIERLRRAPTLQTPLRDSDQMEGASLDTPLAKLTLAARKDIGATQSTRPFQLNRPEDIDHQPSLKLSASFTNIFKDELETADASLYQMPILRAISPLDDFSSDGEDEDLDFADIKLNQSKKPDDLTKGQEEIEDAKDQQHSQSNESFLQGAADLIAEGANGEIFEDTISESKPLIAKNADGVREEVFCQLKTTTHTCFSIVDGKWACYRRNYLKIDASFHLVDRAGRRRNDVYDLAQDSREASAPISHFIIRLSAHVVDKRGTIQEGPEGEVPLIQFGPARERGPREEVRPKVIVPGGELSDECTQNEQVHHADQTIAAFRRVQIRSATLNNGQRGASGQQFYALKLALLACSGSEPATSSHGVEVASLISHPITVRGRSKMHYAPIAKTSKTKRRGATSQNRKRRSSTQAQKPKIQDTRPTLVAPTEIPDALLPGRRRSVRLTRAFASPMGSSRDEVVRNAAVMTPLSLYHHQTNPDYEPALAPAPEPNRSVASVMDIRSVI